MAMFPALMNDTMFSNLFDDPFFEGWRNMDRAAACDPNMSAGMMSTDVRETDKGYMVDIDMPGFKKDDISLDLQNGYLTVSAHRNSSHEDKDDNGRWLRRERYAGSCSRSFYVGEDVKDSGHSRQLQGRHPVPGNAEARKRSSRLRPSIRLRLKADFQLPYVIFARRKSR